MKNAPNDEPEGFGSVEGAAERRTEGFGSIVRKLLTMDPAFWVGAGKTLAVNRKVFVIPEPPPTAPNREGAK